MGTPQGQSMGIEAGDKRGMQVTMPSKAAEAVVPHAVGWEVEAQSYFPPFTVPERAAQCVEVSKRGFRFNALSRVAGGFSEALDKTKVLPQIASLNAEDSKRRSGPATRQARFRGRAARLPQLDAPQSAR